MSEAHAVNSSNNVAPRFVAPEAAGIAVHRRFEHWVSVRPNAIALSFQNHRLTYVELDQRANRVAHALIERGVGPETLVGLCAYRSFDMMVGVLGILKAGGAYVPLDPAYPRLRLDHMMREAGLSVVATQSGARQALNCDGASVLVLDDTNALARYPSSAPAIDTPRAALAYVIYTSGSSGTPKASLLEHRGLANLADAQANLFDVRPDSRVLQFASLSFDAATFEWVMALTAGAQLCLVAEPVVKTPELLDEAVRTEAITHATLPPVLLPMLDQQAWRSVHTLIVAGETCSRVSAERWAQGRRFFNAYGPSEMTVWSTTGRYEPGQRIVHIGTPIKNTQCYVLDASGCPAEEGELYLAGEGIARGYLNQPEQTAARFLPNVIDPSRFDRMYRTGDRVKRLPDGNLEFLGRLDRQIKLRGFRIEPEEIERVLAAHPAVADAAVVIESAPQDSTQLIAYVSVKTEGDYSRGNAASATLEQWRDVFDSAYSVRTTAGHAADRAGGSSVVSAFDDFTGWNSSYTGAAIDRATMEDWRAATVARIRSYEPKRILEVGCGAGLLLSRLVQGCEHYCAMDIAQPIIDRLRSDLQLLNEHAHKVELHVGAAHELERFLHQEFDTIILNSVSQCFPDRDYLDRVVAQLGRLLARGGRLFIGDVRHHGWNEKFHASIETYVNPEMALDDEAMAQRAAERADADKELVIAPDYFVHCARSSSTFGRVELLPKLGRRDCEMNVFRFDAVLHEVHAVTECDHAPCTVLAWREVGSIDNCARLLCETASPILIKDIPNARVSRGHLLRLPELYEASTHQHEVTALDPNELQDLARKSGLRAQFALGMGEGWERFHVVFYRGSPPIDALHELYSDAPRAMDQCCNDPWFNAIRMPLRNALQSYLEHALPDFMRPSAIEVLRRLPLTANGKIDRSKLASSRRHQRNQRGVPPRTRSEERLAKIWAEVLGVTTVGVHDNFYRLGGDSLSAVRMVASIQQQFDCQIALAELQDAPTLESLAQQLDLRLARAQGTKVRAQAGAQTQAREVLRL